MLKVSNFMKKPIKLVCLYKYLKLTLFSFSCFLLFFVFLESLSPKKAQSAKRRYISGNHSLLSHGSLSLGKNKYKAFKK